MKRKNDLEKSEKLVRQILDVGLNRKVGKLAFDLLSAIRSEGQVEFLVPLFSNPNGAIVESAVWIASELGEQNSPIIIPLLSLLDHDLDRVRYYAIEALAASGSNLSGSQLAKLAKTIDDKSAAVRWQTMNALASFTTEQIETVANVLRFNLGNNEISDGLAWLNSSNSETLKEIFDRVEGEIEIARRFGAIALVRLQNSLTWKFREISRLGEGDVKDFIVEFVARSKASP
jgi:HEAT repeat protein